MQMHIMTCKLGVLGLIQKISDIYVFRRSLDKKQILWEEDNSELRLSIVYIDLTPPAKNEICILNLLVMYQLKFSMFNFALHI